MNLNPIQQTHVPGSFVKNEIECTQKKHATTEAAPPIVSDATNITSRPTPAATTAAKPSWALFASRSRDALIACDVLRSPRARQQALDRALQLADGIAPTMATRRWPGALPLEEQLPELFLALRAPFPRRRRAAAAVLSHLLQSVPLDAPLAVLASQLARHPDAGTRYWAARLLLSQANRHRPLFKQLTNDSSAQVRLVAHVGLGADRRWLRCSSDASFTVWEMVERAHLTHLPMDQALDAVPAPAIMAASEPSENDRAQWERRLTCRRIARASLSLPAHKQFIGLGPWLRSMAQFQPMFFAELAKFPGPQADDLLSRLVDWPDLAARAALARALGDRPSNPVVLAALHRLHHDKDDTLPVTTALSNLGTDGALGVLEDIADDPSTATLGRSTIMVALAAMGGERARRRIVDMLKDIPRAIYLGREGIVATAEVGGESIVDALRSLVRHGEGPVRQWASEALLIMGAPLPALDED